MVDKNPLEPGLYEALVTHRLKSQIELVSTAQLHVQARELGDLESADRLANFMERLIRRVIEAIPEPGRAKAAAALTESLITELALQGSSIEIASDGLADPVQILEAILKRLPDGSPQKLELPLTPLIDTTLLTNSPGEPRVGRELQAEIPSADSIDIVIAFIRWSGIYPYLQAFKEHCSRGGSLRILTTTYTNSTELRALRELERIGAEIKVSYDVSSTRLHAKAWLFRRRSEFSTAYIGSSNLSYSAMSQGLEWNVRVSGVRNAPVIDKMEAVFESYWANGDFVIFDEEEFAQRTKIDATSDISVLSDVEVRLLPFQERMLEELQVSRDAGHTKNLLVSATGTGKTVMAAVDFARLRDQLGNPRLLFVAHREEILDQARATFRHVLRSVSFGEKWVGGARPQKFDHVFASIQSLNSAGPERIEPNHFDVVIVDEFHHAAAATYKSLLLHLLPKQLLGLTATPERSDGLDILSYFDGRIASELRVWDAIEQQYLAPFSYYGIHDGVDLSEIPWRRGTGYEVAALANVYTGNDRWAGVVIEQLRRVIGDTNSMRALGFCVSISHAEFMAQKFRTAGIPSEVVVGTTSPELRAKHLSGLASGELNVIFAVDVLNEGVDIPAVDTLLMLRPTESATLFLQQLGRGLRKYSGKSQCTILDFVGVQRAEFRFELKLRALLSCTRKELVNQVQQGFPYLPAGSSMYLDEVSQRIVLDSIRNAIPSTWRKRVEELRQLGDVTLTRFLEETGLELEDIYANNRSWTELRREANIVATPAVDGKEKELLRAIGRLLHVNDRKRLAAYKTLILQGLLDESEGILGMNHRLSRMLAASLQVLSKDGNTSQGIAYVRTFPDVCRELIELFDVLETRIDHVHVECELPNSPLVTHANYSRLEILAAMGSGGDGKTPEWREGVKWDVESKTDILLITIDKSAASFSPNTRYRDYALSPNLIHWESQSTTAVSSPTGQRYLNQRTAETNVALFARRVNTERSFVFLGLADYVQHRGDRPIAITWKLRQSLPGDLFAQFAVAIA
jgi:superfamily II DNA or RNA helicase